MPWVRARLRGQLIYARADAAGALQVESGRVEVRYKPNDGRRYDAKPDNLEVVAGAPLPDDTCGSAESVRKPDASAAGVAAGGAARGRASSTVQSAAQAGPGPVPADAITVYADGACSGNPGPAGLGVVIIDGDRRVELSEYLGEGTNNIAELTAILRALEECSDPKRGVFIHTDSQYSIGVLQKGWKAKANTELVAKVKGALAARPGAKLRYVPGHAGVSGNERADALAREAVRTGKSRRAEMQPSSRNS